MFTTLSVEHLARRSVKEKLYMVKRRQIVSSVHEFDTVRFYTSRLYTYSPNNENCLCHFRENCRVPTIEPTDDIVLKYRYLITLNSVLKSLDTKNADVALVDPNGRLIFLLPELIIKCRLVHIYTHRIREYTQENNRLFSLVGASAVIKESFSSLKKFNAVFSDIPLPFSDNSALFGRFSHFAVDAPILPEKIKNLQLKNDEIYPVLAGLFFVCRVKSIGKLYCKGLQKTTQTSVWNC